MLIWFAAIHHNSYCDFCNEFNLLPHLLFSVTMLRTVGMYLKSDGFQLMREEISTPYLAFKFCITLRLGEII